MYVCVCVCLTQQRNGTEVKRHYDSARIPLALYYQFLGPRRAGTGRPTVKDPICITGSVNGCDGTDCRAVGNADCGSHSSRTQILKNSNIPTGGALQCAKMWMRTQHAR